MNQNDYKALAVLYNSFPDSFEDKEMRLKTLGSLLEGVQSEAICEAAHRFCSGEVKGQSTKKAPTVPEFVQEAKRIHRDVLPYRNKQSLPAPRYEPVKGQSPYEVFLGKLKVEYQDYKLVERIPLEQFHTNNRMKKYPPGTRWQVGRVYVPKESV